MNYMNNLTKFNEQQILIENILQYKLTNTS